MMESLLVIVLVWGVTSFTANAHLCKKYDEAGCGKNSGKIGGKK